MANKTLEVYCIVSHVRTISSLSPVTRDVFSIRKVIAGHCRVAVYDSQLAGDSICLEIDSGKVVPYLE
jgi:hypothetical protein